MKNIPTKWFQNLPPKEQDEFKEVVRSSHRVLERFKQMLLDDLEALQNLEEDIEYYDTNSIAKYAHINGRKASLRNALRYLSFLEE